MGAIGLGRSMQSNRAKLIVCNRPVKWWDEEVKEAITVRREAHARLHRIKLRQDGRSMPQLESELYSREEENMQRRW